MSVRIHDLGATLGSQVQVIEIGGTQISVRRLAQPAMPLFDVVSQIAAQDWGDERIAQLLLELSQSTNDEIDTLASLDPVVTAVTP